MLQRLAVFAGGCSIAAAEELCADDNVDVLDAPGSADLTAHVHFASFAHKARLAGFAADGPISQAAFLGQLGAAERAARLMAANPSRAGSIEAAVKRLMSPTGMGELFKAMVVRSPSLPTLPPFG